ncbi:protein kinase domain-containing protein [Polyangium aurulentum]|uniref:nSTAND1 domain-containing NTPase n=1 Tax=Polyangium aurulentum TaxID=2567896 RepID=UPI0010AE8F4D|nr:SUMF1/EgtB/PvdO family nonheme iron enzyme [Polyangium aurulentum]UQA55053.1 SUMF1/EgtB/PvdO family nonheme iron enzyme [Polyangium aurulentum]
MIGEAGDPDFARSFDEYRILRRLGRGGMGEVYLAHDTLLDRLVAVKFLHAMEPDSWERGQFLVEARAAARLSHPNVVTVHRVGEIDGRQFLVTEFVRGKSLAELPKPVPGRRAIEIAVNLARGLAAAHRRGVLHRDIKPANAILTADGCVKLLDFGLAKLVEPLEKRSSLSPNDAPSSAPGGGCKCREMSQAVPIHHGKRSLPVVKPSAAKPAAQAGDTMIAVRADEARAPSMSRPPSTSAIFGTPGYMAPELWTGEPATCRSDIYSLGALLFELCAGKPPPARMRGGPVTPVLRIPHLAEVAQDVDPRFAAIVDRCLLRAPAERFASAEELRDALEQLLASPLAASIPEGNPYRGLSPFEAEHRAFFFGRGPEIRAIVDRLRADPLVVVAGDSGVGKSSLCRAGVLPLVEEGALEGRRAYRIARLVPGRKPLAALATALGSAMTLGELEAHPDLAPVALGREVRKMLGEDRGLLLFVDQLEELITMASPAEAAVVGEVLGGLAAGISGLRVLMTVRSDFLGRVAALPGIGEDVPRALYLLRPLSLDGIREAILGPSRAKGVAFESDALVDELVASTARAQGGLPLLQFAMAELWQARDEERPVITAQALSAIGGVSGALARHADDVMAALTGERRAAAKRILMALVHVDGTRARRAEDELLGDDKEARAALDALVRGRLVVARDAEQGASYEVAHEALIRGWCTLGRWLEEHAEVRAVMHRLSVAAAEWERLGRSREALWRARQVAECAALDPATLGPREAAFLAASQGALRRSRMRRTAILAGVPLALALGWGGTQLAASRALDRTVATHIAGARATLAEARQLDAEAERLRGGAFDAFDREALEEAEAIWARARGRANGADRAYGRASQELEAALSLDPGRGDVRALLGDALFERALSGERAGEDEHVDDLVARLALYDDDGSRARRIEAPAELAVETSPPAAHVTLVRYESDHTGRLHTGAPRDLGETPTPPLELDRGSYVLYLDAPGRAPVRYPLVVGRGERTRVSVYLPRAPDVSPGFIYVPPGRFLFGSRSDEALRREFLSAAPMHPIEIGGFAIARYETTYGEYLAYLRTLPPEERTLRTPSAGEQAFAGGVKLRELADGDVELLMQPGPTLLAARSAEPIRYPSRSHRTEQRWLNMPVTGISFDDARAYAAWLDKTGRVPGARLCTEREWERAARGADAREFPTGEGFLPDDANFDETYGKDAATMGADEVGAHPASASPFGVEDMVGNVFEWTASTNGAIARGGAYAYGRVTCRSTNRTVLDRAFRAITLGVRICASVPAP